MLVMLLGGSASHAQDTQYWTDQYGTRSHLLSGAVIGSVSDLAATYYNPARLSMQENPGLLLSANVYAYTRLTVDTDEQEIGQLSQSKFDLAPGLSATTFQLPWFENQWFAYSVFPRQLFNVNLTALFGTTENIIDTAPGEEQFATEVQFAQELNDVWHGLSWSYRLSSDIGLGVTQYLAIRSQSTSRRRLAEALTTTDEVVAAIQLDEFSYKTYRLLWKAGIAYETDRFQWGLTLTSPSVKLAGNGRLLYNDAISSVDADGDGVDDGRLTSSAQRELEAQYKWPWSIGTGLAVRQGAFTFHASTEWFAAVDAYDVLDVEPIVSRTSGEVIAYMVTQELDAVLNYGGGVEWQISPLFTAYGSFVTDFSALPDDRSSTASVSGWDIYHLTGGSTFTFHRAEFVLGLGYSFADGTAPRTVELLTGMDTTAPEPADVHVERWRLIFGFSVRFGQPDGN